MVYLIGYISIGALVTLVILVSHQLTKKPSSELESLILDGIHHDRNKWASKLLDVIVVPILGASLAIIAWPVVIYWKIKEVISSGNPDAVMEPKEFSVSQDYLLTKTSIEVIECEEIVQDPLGAVSDLPFGHLHHAWLKFKENLQSGDDIWTFSAQWESEWGCQERLAGYVIVTDDRPNDYFLTTCRSFETE